MARLNISLLAALAAFIIQISSAKHHGGNGQEVFPANSDPCHIPGTDATADRPCVPANDGPLLPTVVEVPPTDDEALHLDVKRAKGKKSKPVTPPGLTKESKKGSNKEGDKTVKADGNGKGPKTPTTSKARGLDRASEVKATLTKGRGSEKTKEVLGSRTKAPKASTKPRKPPRTTTWKTWKTKTSESATSNPSEDAGSKNRVKG